MNIKRAVSVALASLGAFSIAFGQNDGSVKSSSGGGNRHINNTSKKRSKSHDRDGKPKKIYSKSGNKINQIAANFNQNIDDDKTRHRSKSVGMSTGAKVGCWVGGTLATGGAATGLGFGIRHLIRKYGKCDLLKRVEVNRAYCYAGYSEVTFTHNYKNKENCDVFSFKFFLASTKGSNNMRKKFYLVYKENSFEVNNGIMTGNADLPNWGGLKDLEYCDLEKLPAPNGGIWLCKSNNDNDDDASNAFNNAAEFLAGEILKKAKEKMDDRSVNKAYSEKSNDLKLFVKNEILNKAGLLDTKYNLVEFVNIMEDQLNQLRSNGFQVHCVLGSI